MTTTAPAWPARTLVKERNRDALLRACSELVLERGYAGTSLDEVAAQAGLTKGAIYSIFGSKSALFQAVLLPEWSFPLPSQVASGRASLREVTDRMARKAWEQATDPRARRLLFVQLEMYADIANRPDEWSHWEQVFRDRMDVLAGELTARGRLRGPALEVATTLVATLNGLGQLVALGASDVGETAFVRAARAVVLP